MFKVFLAFLGLIRLSYQHARLMEPPSRASMWRVGFPTPKDIDDNQNYCGGFGVQFGQNGGKCGICGDPWHDFPREHEAPDGIYATGKLIKNKLFDTLFENRQKSRIQDCERSELRLHFWVAKSSSKMPKMVHFGEKSKMRHFWWFSNTVLVMLSYLILSVSRAAVSPSSLWMQVSLYSILYYQKVDKTDLLFILLFPESFEDRWS